jgi:hypothetical protein
MAYLVIDLHISRDEYLRWYQGGARAVNAVARDGRRVNFPAASLQRFVGHDGVHGTFAIHFDQNNRLERVERLG